MSTLKAKQFHLIEDLAIAAATLAVIERVEAIAVKVSGTVQLWVRRSNDRRLLAMMNDHLLTDIGLTRADVVREAGKFFWQK